MCSCGAVLSFRFALFMPRTTNVCLLNFNWNSNSVSDGFAYGFSDFSFFYCVPFSNTRAATSGEQRSQGEWEWESEGGRRWWEKETIYRKVGKHAYFLLYFVYLLHISFLHMLWCMRLRVTLCSMNMYKFFAMWIMVPVAALDDALTICLQSTLLMYDIA